MRVGVLFGGRSGEHQVSLHSARAVMHALQQAGHEVVPIGITSEGRWLVGGDPLHALSSGEHTSERAVAMLPQPGAYGLVAVQPTNGEAPPIEDLAGQAGLAGVDVLFPVLHGTYGEDGTVQGLFELAAVPYAGAGVLGSALGMDKVVQKTLWRGMGLPVADYLSVTRRDLERSPQVVMDLIEQSLGYPCFTKPANLGSSVGVSKASNRTELDQGLKVAAQYDAKLIVERGVDARELEVGVLGNEEPTASVVGEILPGAEFYDYRAKYIDNGSQAIIPADVPAHISDEVRRLAVAAFKAVTASGLARVDFFLERGTERLYVNEINTMPGFTEISMYPKLWEASGVPFPELVTRIAELALERYQERSRNRTTYAVEE
ncbi:MAG: D-alanine--D-alanine ligase [Chloroflexi bacterium]|nr:D-alanine--D-alanine ligase [Chloroflexota bacterium]